jgi:hypothetical protein
MLRAMAGTRTAPEGTTVPPAAPRSTLFAVRIWREAVAGGTELRGSARDVVSGAFASFRTWTELETFLAARMGERARQGGRGS